MVVERLVEFLQITWVESFVPIVVHPADKVGEGWRVAVAAAVVARGGSGLRRGERAHPCCVPQHEEGRQRAHVRVAHKHDLVDMGVQQLPLVGT